MTPAYLFFAAAICACVFRWIDYLLRTNSNPGDVENMLLNVQVFLFIAIPFISTMAVASCFVLALTNWTAP